MAQRILLTGGNGFIGTYVASKLLETHFKYNLLSVDNFTDYNGLIPFKELNWLKAERQDKSNILTAEVDIRDRGILTKVFQAFKPTHIVHLAAFPRAKVVDKNPAFSSETLIGGLLNLLELSTNIEQFVYISSSMVYGDFFQPIKEHEPCNPKSVYGVLKLTGESLVKNWAEKTAKPYTIIRPSAVYGPLDVKDRVVSKFFEAALNDGVLKVNGENEKLDFTYVEDLADGIVSIINNPNAFNETFNMSRGHSETLLEAAKTIVGLVGSGTIQIDKPHSLYPSRESLDVTKAGKMLGFNPQTTIEEGFGKYHTWIRNNPIFWNSKTV